MKETGKKRHTVKKLALSAALIAAAGTLLGVGSFASWTATTSNPGNSFATGSLHMSNSAGNCTDVSGTCTAILTATNMKPGGPATTGTVTITNTGSLAGLYSLSSTDAASPAGNTVCTHIDLTITDDATPIPNTIYSGIEDALVASGAHTLTADNPFAAITGAHTFHFSASLDAASPNSEQGATCTAAFTWTAVPA
jgi:predicted ribosomally synthesized peptide with SipW-like signal peptide